MNGNKFQEDLHKAEDLYHIMRIQKNFIEVTHKRAMLTYDHNDLYRLMNKIFEQIHSFSRTQDILFQTALEEYHKREANMNSGENCSQIIPPEASRQLNQLGLHYKASFDQFNVKHWESLKLMKNLSVLGWTLTNIIENLRKEKIMEISHREMVLISWMWIILMMERMRKKRRMKMKNKLIPIVIDQLMEGQVFKDTRKY